ncbi:HNH endonuclease [Vibrio cholerae]|uniref:HNH endonuclease 5 domain-containing protein n=4 Tax=Vibrio TaxID=662 RepID=A0AA34TTH1_9VIBR|nr:MULTISPECIES: HNH endonuclease [Vibrio]ARP40779.1 hypothetical protein K08M4_41180 [Vibrio syngnathi]EGR0773570.1 hypothetical protein [Vibrio cholerae]EGR0778068.1 hypothetical protein [Vibrio cholerae]EGR0780489.1 hypothetical protein [Vibrio cholerae]EGR0823188.1 hypothetical protein [Vibrio cholerae]
MENFRIQLFSTSQLGGILDIGYTAKQSEIVGDLLFLFNAEFDVANQTISMDYKHQYNEAFQGRLTGFVNKYKSILPKIQSLTTKFQCLKSDEWFFTLPPIDLNTRLKFELEKELNQLNGLKSEITDTDIESFFSGVLDNYEIVTFDLDKTKKIKVGEGRKNKRTCRFCNLQSPDVSFKKEAHAISEALGNKKLILNEECDSCNEYFDENVERDFVFYHDLARTMFGIKNKENKTPKMKGKNFEFFKDENMNLNIAVVSDNENETNQETPKSVSFNTGNKIRIQNIYKALCKFALSVMDKEYIGYFTDTIQWIRGEKETASLPIVAVLNSYHFFTERPEITLFFRKNDNYDLPFTVVEFRFTYYMYIFIVPFSSQDKCQFLNESEYEQFLNCFTHIKAKGDFRFQDFSQNIERELKYTINFEQRETRNSSNSDAVNRTCS